MHGSVRKWAARHLERIGPVASCLELGSMDVNGSLRPLVRTGRYVGVDLRAGPGVDVVMDAADAWRLGTFELVLATELLEHARDWVGVVESIKRACGPHGYMIVTARGPGYKYHPHPEDHWRFTRRVLANAFRDVHIIDIRDDPDPTRPGVCLAAFKPLGSDRAPIYLDAEPAPVPVA